MESQGFSIPVVHRISGRECVAVEEAPESGDLRCVVTTSLNRGHLLGVRDAVRGCHPAILRLRDGGLRTAVRVLELDALPDLDLTPRPPLELLIGVAGSTLISHACSPRACAHHGPADRRPHRRVRHVGGACVADELTRA